MIVKTALYASLFIVSLAATSAGQLTGGGGGISGDPSRPIPVDPNNPLLVAIADAAALGVAADNHVITVQEVLGKLAAASDGGMDAAADLVMTAFGESADPIPPYSIADGVVNRAVGILGQDGEVQINLMSLQGGSAVLDLLISGEVEVDTSAMPATLQQRFADLETLGVTSVFLYAARFSAVGDPSFTVDHFGFAYDLPIAGVQVRVFAPLGEVDLTQAGFLDYVEILSAALGMPFVSPPVQQSSAGSSGSGGLGNSELEDCLAAAGSDLETASQQAKSDLDDTIADILGDTASFVSWASWGALGAVGVTAVAGLIAVSTGGAGAPFVAGIALEGVAFLATVGGLTDSALDSIAEAQDTFHDALCAAGSAAAAAGLECFEEYAPELADAFSADVAAALLAMGC